MEMFFKYFLARISLSFLSLAMLLLSSCEDYEHKTKVAMEREAVWIARFWAGNRNMELRELLQKIELEKNVLIESRRWTQAEHLKNYSDQDIVIYSNSTVGGKSLAIHADLRIAWHEPKELRKILDESTKSPVRFQK